MHLEEQTILIAPKGLPVSRTDDGVIIRNEVLGTSLTVTADRSRILQALEFFREPRTVADFVRAGYNCEEELLPLMEAAAVMDVRLLLKPTTQQPVFKALTLDQLLNSPAPDFVVLGVPSDMAAGGEPGARHGPSLIRGELAESRWPPVPEHGVPDSSTDSAVLIDFDFRRLYNRGVPTVADLGDLVVLPGEGLTTLGARIELFTRWVVNTDSRVVILGGDHSVTHFSLSVMLQRYERLGILHFDAHPDLVPPFRPGWHYVTHGNPFVMALQSSALKCLHQVGLRAMDLGSADSIVADPRLSYVSAREALSATPQSIFSDLPRDIPYYLTFDIDCITPDSAPETGTPLIGGLSYYKALELVDYAAREFNIVGCDFV